MAGMYDEDIIGARQQMETARKLREAGVKTPEGQMVSGWYVRPSMTQYLAEALKGYNLRRDEDVFTEKYEDLKKQKNDKISEILRNFPTASTSYPDAKIGADGPTIDALGAPVTKQPTPQDFMSWSMGAAAVDPNLAQFGMKHAEVNMAREDRKEENKLRREEAAAKRAEDWQHRLDMLNMQNQNRMDIARMSAALRPERMITVMDEQGNPVSVPQSQAAGFRPYSPAAAKAAKEAQGRVESRKQVAEAIEGLRANYDALHKSGGITSTEQGGANNLLSKVRSSVVGQAVGGAVGTKEQSLRNDIKMSRPVLLQLIRQATGMSAKAMDSNAELQLYLSAATDPTKGYEENTKALDRLDKMFGLGISGGDMPSNSVGAPPPGAVRRK